MNVDHAVETYLENLRKQAIQSLIPHVPVAEEHKLLELETVAEAEQNLDFHGGKPDPEKEAISFDEKKYMD